MVLSIVYCGDENRFNEYPGWIEFDSVYIYNDNFLGYTKPPYDKDSEKISFNLKDYRICFRG